MIDPRSVVPRPFDSAMCPARSDGFSLVELMVSLAIGLIILAALVALFVGTSRNNREMATAASVIENGRFAIELIEGDVVHAGYWGSYTPDFDDPTQADAPVSTPVQVPDPCEPYDPGTWVTGSNIVNSLIGIPVQSFGGATAVCPAVVTNRVANTDVLVIRHAQRCLPGEGTCEPDETDPATSKLYIQASRCEDELDTPYAFGRTPSGDVYDAPFSLTERNCATPAEKRRYVSYIYWVRDFAVSPGDRIPTLVRAEFDVSPGGTLGFQPAVPLVEGIDGLWVELGIDRLSITGDFVRNRDAIAWADPTTKRRAENRGDGVPDNFVRCDPDCDGLPPAVGDATPPPLDDLTNVTAVKLYVVARSREETRGYSDGKTYLAGLAGQVGPFAPGFKRHLYTTTVRLPNVSGRRERP